GATCLKQFVHRPLVLLRRQSVDDDATGGRFLHFLGEGQEAVVFKRSFGPRQGRVPDDRVLCRRETGRYQDEKQAKNEQMFHRSTSFWRTASETDAAENRPTDRRPPSPTYPAKCRIADNAE